MVLPIFAPDVETLHATSLRWTHKIHFFFIFAPEGRSERDSSGTTEGRNAKHEPEGDGADSPTRANEGSEAARPNSPTKNEIIARFASRLGV
jgi:hypothetical protein